MGEQADLILDGDVCQVCGENFEDEGAGYPRTCSGCGGDDDDDSDIYKTMKDEAIKRRHAIEPNRFEYAIKKLEKLGVVILEKGNDPSMIVVNIPKGRIDFWPYTGWFCGRKPIGNIKGRGIANLIKEIKACLSK